MLQDLSLYQILIPILFSMSPFFEERGGIILALAYGFPPWLAFLVCSLANTLVVVIVFFVLDVFHARMMKLNFYRRKIDKYIEKYRHKFSEAFSKREIFIYLMTFTAIPLPFTGAYTASLLAWLFNVPRKLAYLSISLGVILDGLLITLATIGVIKLL